MTLDAEVAVVGGGPAGASLAALLARAGHEVIVLERASSWRWRACGVFASPAARAALLRIGLEPALVESLAQPIPAMRLETPAGIHVRLTYGDDGSLSCPALGFDRSALDPALLALAAEAGADVRTGVTVIGGGLEPPPRLAVRDMTQSRELRARVIIGADGIGSTVARLAGVTRRAVLPRRVGLTFHLRDPRSSARPPDARMVLLDRAYCGLAPVPGDRVNVGIVLAGARWRTALAREGASSVVRGVLRAIPETPDDPVRWGERSLVDTIVGASPLGHRASRRAGDAWLLIGDAAGFLDPFTGEGLTRALVSAELAAAAVHDRLVGRTGSFGRYERSMRRRFTGKDVVSLLVMAFLERPALLEYAARRLAGRAAVRETMGLVMGDLVPASRALDPRYLAALLRP